MVNFLKAWVKDIAIIFVLISIIEIVLPSSNMKRYIDMVIGLLIIIVLITPFIKLIQKDFQVDREVFFNTVDQIEYEYKENAELASLQEGQVKEIYVSKIKDEIEGLILETTEYIVDGINISIHEDGINYGEIRDVEIILKENRGKDERMDDYVTVVQIEEVNVGSSKEKTVKLQEFENSERIVDIIYKNYNISKENIRVFLNTLGEGE
ncbi:stage III sporulation protein AF [Schnuerera ultunensis]|nr:stage III sporulation protein AF [Schnuerera ultunensis]